MLVDIPRGRVDVTLLRPREANAAQRELLEMINTQEKPEKFADLVGCNDVWEMDLARAKHDALRELIEDAADRNGIFVNVQECQLRRRAERDCYTSDLDAALPAIECSHVTVIRNPSFAQVRHFRAWVRTTLLQRLVVLSSRERVDDLIEDFGGSFHTPYVELGSERAQKRNQPRIFLADDRDESRVADALRTALDFSNLRM